MPRVLANGRPMSDNIGWSGVENQVLCVTPGLHWSQKFRVSAYLLQISRIVGSLGLKPLISRWAKSKDEAWGGRKSVVREPLLVPWLA